MSIGQEENKDEDPKRKTQAIKTSVKKEKEATYVKKGY